MIQWIRICLTMQGTWVHPWFTKIPQVQASKPVHNYWACALEPGSHNSWAHGTAQPKKFIKKEKLPQSDTLESVISCPRPLLPWPLSYDRAREEGHSQLSESSHCSRLNRVCKWKSSSATTNKKTQALFIDKSFEILSLLCITEKIICIQTTGHTWIELTPLFT